MPESYGEYIEREAEDARREASMAQTNSIDGIAAAADAKASRLKELSALNKLAGYASTCRSTNGDLWMRGLVDRLNEVCDIQGERRFEWDEKADWIGRASPAYYEITCPHCGYIGSEHDFGISCADECFCPNGCEWFLMEVDGDDDDE